MEKSAIILAGGVSSRFGGDKGLVLLQDKPLIKHVLDVVKNLVDERVVVSSKGQTERFRKFVGSDVSVVADVGDVQTPLVGALTGFEKARGEHSLLLSCDTPLVSREVLMLLLELCANKSAVVPRWPNGYIEPLQAVYRTKPALVAAENALNNGKLDMRSMLENLHGVRYVSTLVLQQLDPELRTFFNINTPLDLKKAESMLKPMVKSES